MKRTASTPPAPAKAKKPPEAHSVTLPLAQLHANPWNQRRPLDDEFRASIKDQGVIQPILARNHPQKSGAFEIVCGERRWLASKEAGRSSIPTVVRELTDSEAQLCTFLENHHRAGMTFWQEAELLATAAKRPGFTVAGAAAAFGWTEVKVRRRMKLLQLTPRWRKRITDSDRNDEKWTAEMVEMLACYPPAVQDFLEDEVGYVGSMDDLRHELAPLTRALRNAPFDIKDATLDPKAGACLACPKRTGASVDLFGETGETTGKNDQCLDAPCWARKAQEVVARKAAKLKGEHGKVARISTESYGDRDGVLGKMSYSRASKDSKGATPAVVMDGKGVGTTTWITMGGSRSSGGSSGAAKAKPKSPAAARKAKEKELEIRRWVHVSKALEDLLDERQGDPGKLTLVQVAAIASVLGVNNCITDAGAKKGKDYSLFAAAAALAASGEKAVLAHLWDVVSVKISWKLKTRYMGALDVAKEVRPAAEGIARILGVDIEVLLKKAKEEIPDPPAWAKTPAAKPGKKPKGKKQKATDDYPPDKAFTGEPDDEGGFDGEDEE